MLVLKIDGVVCPLADGEVKLPKYSAEKLRSVGAWRDGEAIAVGVVATPEVGRLFGFAGDLHRSEVFNDGHHLALFIVDGVELFSGRAVFLGIEHTISGDVYRVEVRSGGAEWARAAVLTRLKESAVECGLEMNMSGIEASWSNNGAVRMLPVRRDSYPEPKPTGLYVSQQVLLPQDYHPFISVKQIINSIVSESGYTLHSDFLDSPLARRLMISGAYRNVNVDAAYAKMGFKAMRSTTTTATAGDNGRVDAWEPIFASNVGALVDTVNPNVEDENGEPLSEAYSNGGCFRFESGRPMFVPKREISAAFDIALRYTTDYRIVSSERLKGFDRIYLGNECYVDIKLQNPFKDMRSSVTPSQAYKLFIFDYNPDLTYTLMGVGRLDGAVSTVVFPDGYNQTPALYYSSASDPVMHRYTGDWALYEGYVMERGRREVELTIRTPFELCTPTSPKLFVDIYFEGAEAGQQLTLHSGCSISPIFSGAVGYGEQVEFSDVANHDISQAALLEALAHMFNLRIYTHRPSRTIYIEPYDDFYNGEVCDWRARQRGEMLLVDECVKESFVRTKLGYRSTDGAAARLAAGGEFGTWYNENDSYAAKYATDSCLNPLFMPTASFAGAISMAPSAELLTVGDRDVIADGDHIEPRIVLYYGLQTLPQGELWPAMGDSRRYPLVAFHSVTKRETLSFDDCDGCEGLHRYYDRELGEMATRQWLTTEVYLRPEEYVALFDPATDGATIRSRFRLAVGGDSSLFRLEEILDYDTERYVARCRFQRLLRD